MATELRKLVSQFKYEVTQVGGIVPRNGGNSSHSTPRHSSGDTADTAETTVAFVH
jgi:hypothetical protein